MDTYDDKDSGQEQLSGQEIAIVGMSGRFPGARNIEKLWENLRAGKESVSFFSDEELLAAGISLETVKHPQYVKARGVLEGIEEFDAAFFSFTPRDAEIIDPQQRIFLECAWEALEYAGIDAANFQKPIGVYAGASLNTYLSNNIYANSEAMETLSHYQLLMGNGTDFLTTRVSYKLNLNGPSIAVQTGCSTSLVAVHLACQSLLSGECDMALAGGVAISLPQKTGYFYEEGGIGSPDGHCRAFDAKSQGTVGGSGVGIVVLKRLEDALNEKDTIHAIIKGTAINNDGSAKIGYTAPSIDGQAEVIRAAYLAAEVDPATITYVEAHGTGTPLGDPIEIAALSQAFRAETSQTNFCAIGSIKTNIGHLDTAAGVAGLIKTVLALKHREIPPSLHFHEANPKIAFQESPFYVNTVLTPWPNGATPRRAGVSSFGVGGTNCHVILEEAPAIASVSSEPDNAWKLLVLSAQTKTALDELTRNLAEELGKRPVPLADAAYTLRTGRRAFQYRRSVVCRDNQGAIQALEASLNTRVYTRVRELADCSIAFLFSGQGTQYVNMGRDLYANEPVFREQVDDCARILTAHLGLDLREVLYPAEDDTEIARETLTQTWLTQPALFTIEYALAALWMHWGIQPQAMIGHSIGEYVAACLAGVFTLEEALGLVAVRGQLMQRIPRGTMIAINPTEPGLDTTLYQHLSLAAVNSPKLHVLSGSIEAMQIFTQELDQRGIHYRQLHTSHAFHSAMMDAILPDFARTVQQVKLRPPRSRYISNLSGTWITAAEATNPDYWVKHLRQTVQFAAGIQTLSNERKWLFLEIGAGNVLSALAHQNVPSAATFTSLRRVQEHVPDQAFVLQTLGQLWQAGIQQIRWEEIQPGVHTRIPLPTYPFTRQRYWIEPLPSGQSVLPTRKQKQEVQKRTEIADWCYQPIWKRAPFENTALPETVAGVAATWLLFKDRAGIGTALLTCLGALNATVVTVEEGTQFACIDKYAYSIRKGVKEDYIQLFDDLQRSHLFPEKIVSLWSVTSLDEDTSCYQEMAQYQQKFSHLLSLAQAFGLYGISGPLDLWCISNGVYRVLGNEKLNPAQATILGPCQVIPLEYTNVRCGHIDISLETGQDQRTLVEQLLAEMLLYPPTQRVAYRDGQRWQQVFEAVTLQKGQPLPKRLKPSGTYMITGGLGGIGLTIAATIASHVRANLVLLSRSALPEREQWQIWLAEHAVDDVVSQRMQQIQALERSGTRVHVVQADVADQEQMRAVLAHVNSIFGPVHGVIHAAGVAGGGAIQFKEQSEVERVWAAKVQGTLVLAELFQKEPLDFLILCSSLSTVTGGFGQVDYCAANAFMDALTQQPDAFPSRFTCSINWDTWQDVGMAVNTVLPADLQRQRASTLRHGIVPQEGAALFSLILSNECTRVLVSTRELDGVLKAFTVSTSTVQNRDQEYHSSLDAYQRPELTNEYIAPKTSLERDLVRIWSKHLGIEQIGLHDNFFDLGGHSLIMAQIHKELLVTLDCAIALMDLLTYPTIHSLAQYLDQRQRQEFQQDSAEERGDYSPKARAEQEEGIAIIGMAGRFPGAKDIESFWQNVRNGVESISFFSPAELREEGVEEAWLNDPRYVKAGAILEDIEQFDAAFFGYSPREAEGIDPQQRLFLESSWQALERSGYDPDRFAGAIGVYAGLSTDTYLLSNLQAQPDLLDSSQFMMGNVTDFLATRVSYKLNLRGPSIAVQTACSTSLVAVHMACEDLRAGKCDIALAGGASIRIPHKRGYLYDEGGIASPDGHCRAFDAEAQGTIFGNGVGVVVLKRLTEALADNDTIYAVIKGSAINNDGSMKAGFTAPSVQGQTAVITQALHAAQVSSETISYVEAHGTGTALGDPIEVTALTNAFAKQTDKKGFCALGSVKTNIGHLDVAAGVTGLIKTALALKQREIPASLHFQQPNPQIDFANTPFYVNTQLTPWTTADNHPRRAGVSAFGLGGTNAHVILEEAPAVARSEQLQSRPWHLFSLSAKTPSALEESRNNLAAHLEQHPDLPMADISYTLHVGRHAFANRLIVVCRDNEDARTVLHSEDPSRLFTGLAEASSPSLAFMFPGGGAQYINMGCELYQYEQNFREAIDRCVRLFNSHLSYDLKQALYPEVDEQVEIERQIHRPIYSLPLIFTTEYALAQLLMSWGIRPQALIGHSLGEYVAAVLAGVFSLEDAVELVVLRGHLLEQIPDGVMVSLELSEQDIQPLLRGSLSLAAVNNASGSVVAGTAEEVCLLEKELAAQGIESRRLHIATAAHSALLDPVLGTFANFLSGLTLHAPRLPFISNVSGTWITAAEAMDPGYWVKHLRQTVRFAEGIQVLLQQPRSVILEVGPGHTLSVFARRQLSATSETVVLTSLRHAQKQQSDVAFLLQTVGRLWLAGVDVDWGRMHGAGRSRVFLPTYAFERKRYWVDARTPGQAPVRMSQKRKVQALANWFYAPSWRLTPPLTVSLQDQSEKWLLFVDDASASMALVERLRNAGQEVVIARAGTHFERIDECSYLLNPACREDYDRLLNTLKEQFGIFHHFVHCWTITLPEPAPINESLFRSLQERGYYSLLWLAQSLEKTGMIDRYRDDSRLYLTVITNESQHVMYNEAFKPEKSPLLGVCKVLQQEYLMVSCQLVDTTIGQPGQPLTRTIDQVFAELMTSSDDLVVAFRGPQRWVHAFEPLPLPEQTHPQRQFRQKGTYLITGGLGGIGLLLAEHLAKRYQARLILTGRSALPSRDQWSDWLVAHAEDDQTSLVIKKLQAIESLGAEILYFSADVADAIQMQVVIDSTYRRFQSLHGVIHAAGITHGETYSLISEMDQEKTEAQFQPKVYGLYVLEKVLRGKDLDFCLLFSSNASILGGISFLGYTSANLFVDAFAAYQSAIQPVPWISANWDGWQTRQAAANNAVQSSMDRYVLTAEQAIGAFERIIQSAPTSQVIVSSGDLQERIHLWIERETLQVLTTNDGKTGGARHARQEGSVKYVAPRNEIEQAIAEIWQNLLGIEQIGIYDNYFELGGHSLLAIQIAARLRATFRIELPLSRIFVQPSIVELAEYIRQNKEARKQGDVVLSLGAFQVQSNPVEQYDPFPLNDIQQAYWIGRNGSFELSNVSSHSYVEFEYKNLDLPRFVGAWQKVIARHCMLRAIFLPDGRQQILEQVPPFHIETLDLRGAEEEYAAHMLGSARQQMSHQVLAADCWPLFEVRAFIIDDERTRIHISIDALLIDAWSSPILERELAWFYEHPDDNLPPLQLTFRDYILAEEKLHQSAFYEKSRDYWLERLPALPLAPDLPLKKHPGTLIKPQFVRRSIRIKAAYWQQLKAFAAQANLTPSAVLLTAFSEILATWSKTSHFTLNLTLFNRLPLHEQVDDIIGVFTSITLLEINAALHETFEVRAHRTQEQLWNDLDHRYMSGVQVLRELTRLHGDANRATMPVVFTSTLTQGGEARNEGFSTTQAEFVYGISQTPQVWLDHHVGETEGELQLNWDAVEELFPAGLLDDMFEAYSQLVQRLASDKEAWIETNRRHLPAYQQARWQAANATSAPLSSALLHTLFAEQVAQHNQHLAVLAADKRLTYQELASYANRLGRYLKQYGASPNTLVAIVMEKGWEQIVATLGILNAGAAYLPIDPQLPIERIHYLLEHGNVRLVTTQSKVQNSLSWPATVSCICIDTDDLHNIDDAPLPVAQQPQDLAYVIYTSGSAGKPKGVMIDHQGAVNTILDLNQRFELTARDRVLALSSLSFDLSVYDIFGLLAVGGTIVLPPPQGVRDPSVWLQLLVQERVTLWNTVPALMQALLDYVDESAEEREVSSDLALRLTFLSGDWIPLALPRRIRSLANDVRVISMGGATEASIWSIIYPVEELDPTWKSIPYGKAMINQKFYVLDEHLEERPAWVPGNLYIGGIGLARGYWQDPEKTQASFITHPRTGERLYCTGDLGRYYPDGNIEFLGREDFQVKIQGFRVELGEIEYALTQHPEVHEAVVTAMSNNQGGKSLVAYIVPQTRTAVDAMPTMYAAPVPVDHDQQVAPSLADIERLTFKSQQLGMRQDIQQREAVQLLAPDLDEARKALYYRRQSYRSYVQEPVSFEQFSALLDCLLQVELEEFPFPKHLYASAGSLYPVQCYIYVKPDAVEHLSAGTYYYHPGMHKLVLLTPGASIDRHVHAEVNQPIFSNSAFSLFLVGKLQAITPLYGEVARDYCLLEAGYMSQLLMMTAPNYRLGLCPVGGLNFAEIRNLFCLDDDSILLHSLLGGNIDPHRTDPPQQKRLEPLSLVDRLKQALEQQLPRYMQPTTFVMLDTLPLSSNGKVDRKALPLPALEVSRDDVAPRSDLEKTLVNIWKSLLGLEHISIHDNYFLLGGDSLQIIKMVTRAKQDGIALTYAQVVMHQTIAELAQVLTA